MNKSRKKKPKAKKPVTHEQWIDIRCVDGKLVCNFFPPNKEFELERQDMDPQPDLIYRRLNFINGVPQEFNWTHPTDSVRLYGGHFLQRMKIKSWLKVMAAERFEGRNIPICCDDPQPRPEAYGPCPCERCTNERDDMRQRD